jgi:hypothetical protein
MPTTPLIQCEADATAWQSPAYGAGTGQHLPIGTWQGTHYRSIVRFPIPSGWTGWTGITKATLSFATSDFAHVGVRNSTINVYRQAISSAQWTKAEGSSVCESLTSGNTTQYSDMAPTSSDSVSFSSGSSANAPKSVDVTAAIRYYQSNNAKPVFIFDGASSSDYTELWSRDKTGGYDITLSIDYTVQSVPNAPTLNSPVGGATVVSANPTINFTPSDPQGDTCVAYRYQVALDAGFTSIYEDNTVSGSFPNGVAINRALVNTLPTRGSTYYWRVMTSDAATGYGPWATGASFVLKALPVVTVDATRYMVFSNGAPRLQVRWSCNQPQVSYRVTATGGYDSGLIPSTAQQHTLDTLAVTSGTPVTITVAVTTADPLTGSASQAFTPRYGLTVHRRDLGSVPAGWGVPAIDSGVMPTDASLVIEYGSNTSAVSAPTQWYSSLGPVPLAQWLFYRAWFIPSNTAGPTLNSITIPVIGGVQSVDKWGTTRGSAVLAAPWSVSVSEFVYGTRSVQCAVTGAGPFYCYSFPVAVKPGRNYILTGLMKSIGNSGACIELQDAAGNVLQGGGMALPPGPVKTDILTADKDWYASGTVRDTNRYKTPVYVADSDRTVYVVLKAGGAANSKAFFDAVKLEESTVATPWSPGAVGATVIDSGGVQIDGSKGGVLRYKGSTGGTRDMVEGGPNALRFGSDTDLFSPISKILRTNRAHILTDGTGPSLGASGSSLGQWAKVASGRLNAQFEDIMFTALVTACYDGSTVSHTAFIHGRIKQNAALGSQPSVDIVVNGGYSPASVVVSVTQVSGPILWDLWVQTVDNYQLPVLTIMQVVTPVVGDALWPVDGGSLQAGLPPGTLYYARGPRMRGSLDTGGTAFPTNPATNDLFYRTDWGWWFTYDGTRWRSQVNEASSSFASVAATSLLANPVALRSGDNLSLYLRDLTWNYNIVAPHSATQYWNLSVNLFDNSGYNTPLSIDTNKATAGAWVNPASIAIGSTLTPAWRNLYMYLTKTGTVGAISGVATLRYQWIAT